jgi:hypothetical protein
MATTSRGTIGVGAAPSRVFAWHNPEVLGQETASSLKSSHHAVEWSNGQRPLDPPFGRDPGATGSPSPPVNRSAFAYPGRARPNPAEDR